MSKEYKDLEITKTWGKVSTIGSGAGGVRSVKSISGLEKQLEDRIRMYNKLSEKSHNQFSEIKNLRFDLDYYKLKVERNDKWTSSEYSA